MTRPGSASAPEEIDVPLLGHGRHSHPRQGACLMELVGAFTGGPWTDRPLCTQPALAQVARAVNDATSIRGRPLLAVLVPHLTSEYGATGEVEADIVVTSTVVQLALAITPDNETRNRAHAIEKLTSRTGRASALSHRRHHRLMSLALQSIREIRDVVDPGRRDLVLYEVLIAAINAGRSTPVVVRRADTDAAAGTITLLSRWRRPRGADWLELEVTAEPDSVPVWLAEAWREQQFEPQAVDIDMDRASPSRIGAARAQSACRRLGVLAVGPARPNRTDANGPYSTTSTSVVPGWRVGPGCR